MTGGGGAWGVPQSRGLEPGLPHILGQPRQRSAVLHMCGEQTDMPEKATRTNLTGASWPSRQKKKKVGPTKTRRTFWKLTEMAPLDEPRPFRFARHRDVHPQFFSVLLVPTTHLKLLPIPPCHPWTNSPSDTPYR